jgi:hypothetical protein
VQRKGRPQPHQLGAAFNVWLHDSEATNERMQAQELSADSAPGAAVDGVSLNAAPTVDDAGLPREAPAAERAANVHEGQTMTAIGRPAAKVDAGDLLARTVAQSVQKQAAIKPMRQHSGERSVDIVSTAAIEGEHWLMM